MDQIKTISKALAGWLAGVIVSMIYDLTEGGVPFPQTKEEWLRYVLTSFGVAIGVFLAPANKMTPPQVEKQVSDLPLEKQVDVVKIGLDHLPRAVQENIARARLR